jgi:hypothetical protein
MHEGAETLRGARPGARDWIRSGPSAIFRASENIGGKS